MARVDVTVWSRLARLAHYRVRAFAKLCGESDRGLYRRVERAAGCAPHQLLDGARSVDVRFLLQGDEPLKSVSDEAGFTKESNFCRWFKAKHGITPGKWRAQRKASGGEGADWDRPPDCEA